MRTEKEDGIDKSLKTTHTTTQTTPTYIQPLPGTAPHKHKSPLSRNLFNLQIHNILPVHRSPWERGPTGPALILLEGWGYVDHVELCTQGVEVEGLWVAFEVHGLSSTCLDLLVLGRDIGTRLNRIRCLYTLG